MKPLKLYARTTVLTSAVLVTVLAAVVYFFVTRIRDLELQDQQRRAMLWATQLANQLAYESPRETSPLRNRAVAFSAAHEGNIDRIRIYGETKKGLREVITLPADAPEEMAADDLKRVRRAESFARLRTAGDRQTIYAVAPIFDENRFVGAVAMVVERVAFSDLSQRIVKLMLALLAVAIISITALLYFLFSQVLYRPVEDLLKTMTTARTGNLDTAAPVRARDEFGELAVSFNELLARLRAMTAEREAHQKQLEDRVREATFDLAERNTQLEEANAALFEIQRELTTFERLAAAGRLAAQFAHEVGTPLNLISGHVQLLAARTEDAKTRDRLDLITSQIARIERIVRNMLDATRRPQPQLEATDLNALLRRIFEITAPTLAAHQVELITDCDEALPPVSADGEQLQQVFINLINNSLDAMPHGGSLSFTTALTDGRVSVTCRDTGEGIKAEIKPRIFDPLFTTKARGRGSGLGLAVVQQIVREHGGEITVESEFGQGAEFQLRLPLVAHPLECGGSTPLWSALGGAHNEVADATAAPAESQSIAAGIPKRQQAAALQIRGAAK